MSRPTALFAYPLPPSGGRALGRLLLREPPGTHEPGKGRRLTGCVRDALRQPLSKHLESSVRELFEKDRAGGLSNVQLPDVLDRKYPNAGKEWGWQWVFPAQSPSKRPAHRDCAPPSSP